MTGRSPCSRRRSCTQPAAIAAIRTSPTPSARRETADLLTADAVETAEGPWSA